MFWPKHIKKTVTKEYRNYTQLLFWIRQGKELYQRGNLNKAIQCYEKAVEVEPEYEKAWYNLALMLKEKGDVTRATECLLTAIQINPGFKEALLVLGKIEMNHGSLEEAEKRAEKILETDPDDKRALELIGIIALKLEKYNQSIVSFSKLLTIEPTNYKYANNIAWSNYRKKDFENAKKFAEKSVELSERKFIPSLDSLACILFELEQYKECVAVFKEILKLNPEAIEKKLMNEGTYYLASAKIESAKK